MEKVVLVTGANKGIGKEISRMLGSVAGVKVVMGARDSKLGIAAAAELKAKNCDVVFHQLDLTDHSSIERTYEFLAREFGRVDIIINNAALCYNDPTLYGKCAFTSFQQQAAPTISTNFFGTLDVTQTMLPLLRKSSSPRIINIASSAGRLSILRSKEKLEAFTSPNLQISELELMMKTFVSDVEKGTHVQNGWANTCYGMSKIGVIAMSKVFAREEPGIMVNIVDPGYCATDQNMNQGSRTAEQGARTPVKLALLPQDKFVTGKYFFDDNEIKW